VCAPESTETRDRSSGTVGVYLVRPTVMMNNPPERRMYQQGHPHNK
jgi:hypothetical protein